MACRTSNIVTTYDGAADDAILETIRATFPYVGAARFNSGLQELTVPRPQGELEEETDAAFLVGEKDGKLYF